MARFFILLACAGSLLLGACVSDSSLPVATGKASVRAINAIEASPDIVFLIEERSLSQISYKNMSSLQEYDDLDFTFNFDIRFTGDSDNTRIASQAISFVADQDYTLLVSGTLANASITVWEAAQRTFDADATVFQANFAHASSLLGTVDYYFAAAGIDPVMGAAVATLSFGEAAPPVDFEAGNYVMIITAAGDPGDVLYTSVQTTFGTSSVITILPFDGDADDNAPVVVRAITAVGTALTMASADHAATVQFLHASTDLGIADIYDDEMLTSQLIANHAFKELSADVEISAIENIYRYTPAGGTSMVTVEGTLNAFPGNRYRFIALGQSGGFTTDAMLLDRRPIDSTVKILLYQASFNYDFLNLYAVDPDTTIEGKIPFFVGLATGVETSSARLAPGIFDIYVTESGETEVLAGPVRIDVTFGDVVDMVIFDTVDPAQLEIVLFP